MIVWPVRSTPCAQVVCSKRGGVSRGLVGVLTPAVGAAVTVVTIGAVGDRTAVDAVPAHPDRKIVVTKRSEFKRSVRIARISSLLSDSISGARQAGRTSVPN